MSDTMANESVLERPSDNGQVERANAETSQGESDGRASTNGQPANEKDNIRKLQSTYDTKLAQQQQAFQAQQQQAYAQINHLQQRLNQMEEAAAPDDYAKLELKLQREQQARQVAENAYYQLTAQQQQALQAEQSRVSALTEIAGRYGIDIDDLADAKDYFDAIDKAHELRDARKQQTQEQAEQKRTNNRPDVGGGRTSTPSSRWEQEYEAAQKARDSVAMMRLLREQNTRK